LEWDSLIEEAKTEASLTVALWRDESFWNEAATEFGQKYGIEVEIQTETEKAILDKITGEKEEEEGTVDVVLVGDSMVREIMDEKLLYGPLVDYLPHGSKLDTRLSSTQANVDTLGYLVPLYQNQIGLLYDPKKAEPPQTWFELIEWVGENPKKLAFSDPRYGNSGQAIIQTALANLCGGLDRYRDDTRVIDSKTENWSDAWSTIKPNLDYISVTSSEEESVGRLNKGEASLIVTSDTVVQLSVKKRSLSGDMKLYVPKMGMPYSGDTLGILENAPNKASAILFVSYLTEVESQKRMNDELGLQPAHANAQRTGVSVAEKQKYGIAWIPDVYRERYTADFVENVLE
jgi:ABC-type uncharacterized transport system YnjBCD substrate-binding protein